MKKAFKLTQILLLLLLISSCFPEGFKEQAKMQFGDQHFKTAISLIELHKIREGEYPQTLDSLKFMGDWDKIIFNTIEYTKLKQGYKLDLRDDVFLGKHAELDYPEEFWKGLGLTESNLKGNNLKPKH